MTVDDGVRESVSRSQYSPVISRVPAHLYIALHPLTHSLGAQRNWSATNNGAEIRNQQFRIQQLWFAVSVTVRLGRWRVSKVEGR